MNESDRTARASALERSLRASALDRVLRRAAVRECEKHAPGLRDVVLEAIRAPERAQVRRFTTWKLAASVAALFTLAALGVFAARIVREESAATAARDVWDGTAARGVWDGTAARGMGRDPELAVPRALPHAASVANSSSGVVPAIAGPVGAPRPASRDLLARTLPESRALDTALRGELAELGRDTLALARFVFESARLGPPPSGS